MAEEGLPLGAFNFISVPGTPTSPAYVALIDKSTGLAVWKSLAGIGGQTTDPADANGGSVTYGALTELMTLATGATTTDSVQNLLPANAIIKHVLFNVVTTITTAANFSIGDATTAARFKAATTNITAGLGGVGLDHWSGAVTTLAAGPSQAAAAKLRITCNVNPGAGAVRVTVVYELATAPTT